MKKNFALILSIVMVTACSAKRSTNRNGQISNNVNLQDLENKLEGQSVDSSGTATSSNYSADSLTDKDSASGTPIFDNLEPVDTELQKAAIQHNNQTIFNEHLSVEQEDSNKQSTTTSNAELSAEQIFQNAISKEATEEEKKQAIKLQQTAQQTLSLSEVQPGYPTWYGLNKLGLAAKPGAMPGVGWSALSSFKIVSQMGSDMDLLLVERDGVKSIEWTNSSDIRSNLLNKVDSSIREVTTAQAQFLANKGMAVLATSIQKDKSFVRLGVVVPSAEEYKAEKGAKISSASPRPGYYLESDFVSAGSDKVQYFLLTKSLNKSLKFDEAAGTSLFNKIASLVNRAEIVKSARAEEGANLVAALVSSTGTDLNLYVSKQKQALPESSDILENLKATQAREIKSEEAQEQANLGKIVVAEIISGKKISVGVVAPNKANYNSKVGAKVVIGGSNPFVTLQSLVGSGKEVVFYLQSH